jgi:hypothetical protein
VLLWICPTFRGLQLSIQENKGNRISKLSAAGLLVLLSYSVRPTSYQEQEQILRAVKDKHRKLTAGFASWIYGTLPVQEWGCRRFSNGFIQIHLHLKHI